MNELAEMLRDATEPDRPFGPRSKIIAWRDGRLYVENEGDPGGVPIEKRSAPVPEGLVVSWCHE